MRWCSSAAMLRYMHVITGRFKGMPLATPRAETRPTTDRTKEALFSRLESHGLLQDARVLDLFGGTGALGIEALSRGARANSSRWNHPRRRRSSSRRHSPRCAVMPVGKRG